MKPARPLAMMPAEKSVTPPTDPVRLAAQFRALGDPTRLRIYQFLRGQPVPVAVDDDGQVRPMTGPTVGEVCCHITGKERITSTISEHLKELRLAGLIVMERRGKNMVCSVSAEQTALLAAFFTEAPDDAPCCAPGKC